MVDTELKLSNMQNRHSVVPQAKAIKIFTDDLVKSVTTTGFNIANDWNFNSKFYFFVLIALIFTMILELSLTKNIKAIQKHIQILLILLLIMYIPLGTQPLQFLKKNLMALFRNQNIVVQDTKLVESKSIMKIKEIMDSSLKDGSNININLLLSEIENS